MGRHAADDCYLAPLDDARVPARSQFARRLGIDRIGPSQQNAAFAEAMSTVIDVLERVLPAETMRRLTPVLSHLLSHPDAPVLLHQMIGVLESAVAHHIATVGMSQSVLKAIAYIQSNYAQPLNTSEIARHVGESRAALCARFRRETGHTLHAYLNLTRTRTAAPLLFGGTKIEAIAYEVGFRSKSTLYRLSGYPENDAE